MPFDELLPWYDLNKRDLPFRGTHDAYRVWLSEIMLQQTRTETVGAYYARFLARFPTVQALAEADEQAVLKLWEGLGYYSRARNLHAAAKKVVTVYGSAFPADYDKLRALPGVGDYTAAAVASIAFHLPRPAMDGNLTRVLSRVHGVREDVGMPSVKRKLLALAEMDIDRERPGDFNQALMDIGAGICVPGTPDCARCPLHARCDAYRQGDMDVLPVRAAAKPPKEVCVGVGIVTCGGRALLFQRDKALLRGLWVFALNEGDDTRAGMGKRLRALGLRARCIAEAAPSKHVFTHRVWQMRIYHFAADAQAPIPGCRWEDARGISALPLPTAMRSAKAYALRVLNDENIARNNEDLPC